MAQKRKIQVHALNIRVHPHDGTVYEKLFSNAYRLKQPINARGDQKLIISSINEGDHGKTGYITGEIAKFTEIDFDLPWFDVQDMEKADETDLKKIQIPENLRPNYISFTFAFKPEQHKFFIETYSSNRTISPNLIQNFLEHLLNDERMKDSFSIASVDIISDHEKFEQLFEFRQLKRMQIFIKLPNPDTPRGIEEEVEARLRGQNGKSLKMQYEHEDEKSFTPDEKTKQFAQVAMRNGQVDTIGEDENGLTVTKSSASHPRYEISLYDPNKESRRGVFFRTIGRILASL